MLHVWLIPAVALLAVVICAFYFLVKYTGGAEGKRVGYDIGIDELLIEDRLVKPDDPKLHA